MRGGNVIPAASFTNVVLCSHDQIGSAVYHDESIEEKCMILI